jgi:aarF domain-containing kinase
VILLSLIPITASGIYLSRPKINLPFNAIHEEPNPLTLLLSPAEPELSALRRLVVLAKANVIEPMMTARRFLYLVIIFIPVVFATPMLLIGPREKKHGGERWGAVKWYDILTRQMERAGPTFVKVRFIVALRRKERCDAF